MKSFLIRVYGWVLIITMFYVSLWLLFIKPLIDLVTCEVLTGGFLIVVFLKLLLSLPVAKLIRGIGITIAVKVFM